VSSANLTDYALNLNMEVYSRLSLADAQAAYDAAMESFPV
jgi:hypothetical protein